MVATRVEQDPTITDLEDTTAEAAPAAGAPAVAAGLEYVADAVGDAADAVGDAVEPVLDAVDDLALKAESALTSSLDLIEDGAELVTLGKCTKIIKDHRVRSFLWAMIVLGAYFGLAMLWLGFEDWSVTDAVYFAAMTCSTVGYGDISPSSTPVGSRAFTVFMIFIGIAVVFPAVGSALSEIFLEPITKQGRALLERCFPQRKLDLQDDGSTDFTVPRHPFIYYPKNLLPSLLLNLTAQCISAAIFCTIEDWDYGSSIYHCLVTATTVGYGDQYIATDGGRQFASVHMLVSVVLLAELLSSIDDARTRRKAQLARVWQLKRELDRPLVGRLMQRAVELRPKVHRDGKGVTELEFVIGMLVELEAVELDLIMPFVKQFRQLDITNDGRLGIEDLVLKESLSRDDLLKQQKQNSIKNHTSGVALVSLSANGSGSQILQGPAKPSQAAS